MSVRSPLLAAILFASIAFPSGLYGQEDEDEDALPAGLSATYTAAGRTVERVDPDIAFSWGNRSPDARLPPGPFRAQWHGRILVQTETRYVFHAYVDGAVSIKLDGKLVAEGKTDAPGWISGEVLPIEFGEKELQVEYRKTGENSRVQLFWSSDRFPVEPLPVHLIFHEQKRPELALIEKGRREFEGFRCGRCHQGIADSADMPAPALTTVAALLSREDLIAKIRHSESDSAHSRMPDFGFSVDEGTAIAAYLLSASQEVKFDEPSTLALDPNQRKNGQELAHTIGCLACHQIGAIGQNGPYSGGDLTHVAAKRSVHWLFNWLKNPERVNPDHRMPVFELSEKERGHLASYLSSLKKAPERTQVSGGAAESQGADDAALVDAGRKLVADARCAACHRLPQNSVESKTHARPFAANSNWSKSCASEQLNRTGRQPRYHGVDGTAIQAFVTAHAGTTTPESPFAQGARLFEQRNCVACHRRDGAGGLEATAGAVVRADASLKGQSETLVPPVLNAVGDKLTDAALAKSIRGEQKPRMDWLRVQMPRFRHSPAQQDALLTYFVAHDRIPDGAPLHPTSPQKQAVVADGEKKDASTLIAGHAIVGAQGWNCLACHQAGRFVPKNVAPATRGSDLLAFGSRMRREFFLRWTRSPLRVAPGIEMPAYERPVPGVLDGDIDRQFAALWSALNDPQFTVPTNPTAVEQFFTVKKGDGARIVHDVFTNPKSNGGGNIPRALAIGLNNGHNLLYDLSTFTIRQWTFGDFARQRTEGKSWYWDMAGLAVATGFPTRSDIALLPLDQPNSPPILPVRANGTCGKLTGYENRDRFSLSYELSFEIHGEKRTLSVQESIEPADRRGFVRRIQASGIPQNYVPVFLKEKITPLLGAPKIEPKNDDDVESSLTLTRFRFLGGTEPKTSTMATLPVEYLANTPEPPAPATASPFPLPETESVTTVPGFDGLRLPFARSIMPTAMTFTGDGNLAFSSLKGLVHVARDTNRDGIEDRIDLFEEGLASAYGLIADGKDLIVSHKPEVLRLSDTNGDGRADVRKVIATGWGMTDNYHDWTCGIVRDSAGNLYVGLGSDYTQKKRKKEESLWRGKVLRIDPHGHIEPVGHAFRYPTGLAIDEHDRVFVTDQQGEQNAFNEINFLMPGRHYGVAARHEEEPDAPDTWPAVAVPHPWTRSVNGITFLPRTSAWGPFAGHGIGCEYDSRFLIRFTIQTVGDAVQGAVYHFSRPDAGAGSDNFRGPLCVAARDDGTLYIGSIHDSGWLGGQNVGDVVRLRANNSLPNGIREIRATHDGFEIDFIAPVDRAAALNAKNYSISGYTRVWKGGYATPDSSRHRLAVKDVSLTDDAKSVRLITDPLREMHVYEVTVGRIATKSKNPLFPATGHYTMLRVPPP